eukprot:gene22987-30175_t
MAHDEGACYAPSSVWKGILLSHWGRTDFPHTSLSQYWQDSYTSDMDNYTSDMITGWQQKGWVNRSSAVHPCFDPKKGDVGVDRTTHGDTTCRYSRCIRQRLYNLSKQEQWRAKHNVWFGTRVDVPGDYTELMGRSTFCFHLPGDGWSSRFEEALLHGCIPVVIMDGIYSPFETLLDVDAFSIRIAE